MTYEQEEVFLKNLWMKVYVACAPHETARGNAAYDANEAIKNYKKAKENGAFEIK